MTSGTGRRATPAASNDASRRTGWSALVLVCVAALLFAVPAATSYASPSHLLYSQDFESSDGGLTSDGGTINWGRGASTYSGGPTAAHSGTNLWGTGLSTGAGAGTYGSVVSGAIALPAVGAGEKLSVSFWAYCNLVDRSRGTFSVSPDGTNWTQKTEFFTNMQGYSWQEYAFDVTSLAGGSMYLKFYAATQAARVPGVFIDDLAVTRYDSADPSDAATLTLSAFETASSSASCPWLFSWDGSGFVRDNDIYPVMRFATGERRDYYLMEKPLVSRDGAYRLEIRELETEDSFTDLAQLLAVDHAAGVSVGTDASGRVSAYRAAELVAPVTAVGQFGADLASVVGQKDGAGAELYSGDTVELDFGPAAAVDDARLILRFRGFMDGTGAERPFVGPPAVVVDTLDGAGAWVEAGRVLPRMDWSEGVVDLTGKLGAGARVRVRSISHGQKYQLLDHVALSTGVQPAVSVTELALTSASKSGEDVRDLLTGADDRYVTLTPANSFDMAFAVAPQVLAERDFVFVSEGYYVPKSGTFYIYTWDGSAWKMRDGLSMPTSVGSKIVDLGAFVSDAASDNRVRIWQTYSMSPAGIDAVQLSLEGEPVALHTAVDLYDSRDVYSYTYRTDGSTWNYNGRTRPNRWIEFSFIHSHLTYTPGSGGTISGSAVQSVSYGDDGTEVTAVPNTGYHFVNWSDGVATTARTDLDVTQRLSVTANFAINTYSVRFVPGANGTLTGTVAQTVNYGANSQPVTANPSTGYHLVDWTGTGSFAGSTANPLTVSAVSENVTVTANFAINVYAVAFQTDGTSGSSLTGTTSQSIAHGGDATEITASAPTGYHLEGWSGTGGFSSTDNPLTLTGVTQEMTVTADFAINMYAVAFQTDDTSGSSLTGTTSQSIAHGGDATEITANAPTGYHFEGWSGTGGFSSTDNPLTLTGVTQAMRITAGFDINMYSLCYGAGTGGSITGASAQSVAHGSDGTEVEAVPDYAYGFTTWSDDVLTRTRTDAGVTGDATYTASFVAITGSVASTSVSGVTSVTIAVEGAPAGAVITADPSGVTGVDSVIVDGVSVKVLLSPTFSGVIELPIMVSLGGGHLDLTGRITVVPADPAGVTFQAASLTGTLVHWTGVPNATGYRVRVGGSIAGETGPDATSFTIPFLAGPGLNVTVEAMGGDRTGSASVRAVYASSGVRIVIGTIRFYGDSARLNMRAVRTIKSLARLVVAQGYNSVEIDGYTATRKRGSARFRARLSAKRALAVRTRFERELRRLRASVVVSARAWGGSNPIATPPSFRNRRAEIVVR
jgi:outer membrane protein OmpA-like peptidoglycan-associated protein